MNSVAVLILTVSGINLLAVLAVVLKGGVLLGTFQVLVDEVGKLRTRTDLHSEMLARAVQQLDDLERRVEALEKLER